MISDAYREAHEKVDYVLNNLTGLADALRELSRENAYLGSTDEDAQALMAIIIVMSDQLHQIHDLRILEWAAVRDGDAKAA